MMNNRLHALAGMIFAAAAFAPFSASGYSFSFGETNLGIVIPDDVGSPIRREITISDKRPGPYKIEVSLKLLPNTNSPQGGMLNGDYAAYLIHTADPEPGPATNFLTAVLLNRVGKTETNSIGYFMGNGIDITLKDDGLSNVHVYEEPGQLGGFQMITNDVVTGTYNLTGTGIPDGRLVNPTNVVASDPVTNLLGPLGLRSPNGSWQFKIQDMHFGYEGILDSWGVTVTQLGLIASNSITTIPTGEDVAYPDVVYEPEGVLDIQPGSELTIDDLVIMPGKTTTTVNGVFNMMSGGASEACSILNGNGVINIMGGGPLVLRGRISPGNSIGTLTFNGNIVLDSITCRTELEVAGPNSFDRIIVNGAATLNSPSLEVTTINGGTLAYGQKVEFFTASGGITGMYGVAAMPAGYRANFLVSGNSITLVVAPESYTQVAVTPNQRRVAKALDSFIDGEVVSAADCLGPLRGVARTVVLDSGDRGEVSLALDLLTAEEYPAAFEQIMPSLYATLPTLAFNQANMLNMNMFQRMWMQRIDGQGFSARGIDTEPISDGKQFVQPDGKSVADGKNAVERSLDAPVEMWQDPERPWGLFVDGNGIFSEMDTVSSLGSYDSQGGGVTVGASYRWNDSFTTGVYVGYQGLVAKYDNGSRLTDNAVRFGTFATYGTGNFYANAIVGGAYHGYNIDRSIEFSTIDRTARSNPDAWEFDAALVTGYNFRLGGLVFGPVTSLQYTYIGVQGVKETGAQSLNLEIDPYNSSSLLYSLGAQIAYPLQVTRKLVLTPMIFASWQHEFLQNGYNINAAFFEAGPRVPFSYATEAPQRDYLYAGAGLSAQLGDRWEAYLSYSAAAAATDLISNNIFLGLQFNF